LRKILPHKNNKPTAKIQKLNFYGYFLTLCSFQDIRSKTTQHTSFNAIFNRPLAGFSRRGGLLMVSKISSPEFSRVTKRSIQGF
jgi:hypothetical protein